MNKREPARTICWALALVAAALLGVSLTLPLWHLRMEAPQYRDEEALKVTVYPHALRGDLNEIRTLNQYIGVHVPTQLPQLRWLPLALIGAGALGLAAVLLPARSRRVALVIVPGLLMLALLGAALQAQRQMFDIGHKRDPKPELVGVGDFTPPLLGETRIAQFTVRCGFGAGTYVIGAAVVLQLLGAWASRRAIVSDGRPAELIEPSAAQWDHAADAIEECR